VSSHAEITALHHLERGVDRTTIKQNILTNDKAGMLRT
jgi:hypothetical protein